MNAQGPVEIRVVVSQDKPRSTWIARGVEHGFIAQGPSIDAAIDCFVACVMTQFIVDTEKKRMPLSKRPPAADMLLHIFEGGRIKYSTRVDGVRFGPNAPDVTPTLVYA